MSEEERYESINIWVKVPEGESWFDRIFDLITEGCEPYGEDEDGNWTEVNTCTCGLETMGGCTGTLEQLADHDRISEKWAQDVLAEDLKIALHRLSADTGMPDDVFDRLRRAAYYHEDIQAWFDSLPEEDEDE